MRARTRASERACVRACMLFLFFPTCSTPSLHLPCSIPPHSTPHSSLLTATDHNITRNQETHQQISGGSVANSLLLRFRWVNRLKLTVDRTQIVRMNFYKTSLNEWALVALNGTTITGTFVSNNDTTKCWHSRSFIDAM